MPFVSIEFLAESEQSRDSWLMSLVAEGFVGCYDLSELKRAAYALRCVKLLNVPF